MNLVPLHLRPAILFAIGLSLALLTTVAGTNIMVLLLLLAAPWAWIQFLKSGDLDRQSKQLFALIVALSIWSIFSNAFAGYGLHALFKDLLHDMRTFVFVVLLWPIFAFEQVSRASLWALLGMSITLATGNLALTVVGFLPPGKYFWSAGPHLYGQILVGIFFLLAQMFLVRPKLSWRVILPMALLLISLFFASSRRTGYLQLAACFLVWFSLNRKQLLATQYKWWLLATAAFAIIAALASPIFQSRMEEVVFEVQQFLAQTSAERTAKDRSVGIRLQYYLSVWELIKQNNAWFGVGSINFSDLFWQVNHKMGGTERSLFSNPHNEYLYTLATKGVVGLALYLAIFGQACRIALRKTDAVQRVGLLVFIFLFMLSITTNSMMIDMEEGHFTMLILLIFLAPKNLNLLRVEKV